MSEDVDFKIVAVDADPVSKSQRRRQLGALRDKASLHLIVEAVAVDLLLAELHRNVSACLCLCAVLQDEPEGWLAAIASWAPQLRCGAAEGLDASCAHQSAPGLAVFRSWLRTIRPGVPPSELVAALALRNSLPDFLARAPAASAFVEFLRKQLRMILDRISAEAVSVM